LDFFFLFFFILEHATRNAQGFQDEDLVEINMERVREAERRWCMFHQF